MSHRLISSKVSRLVWLSTKSTIQTWYRPSSNRCEIMSRGSEDRYIYYQLIYAYINGALMMCDPYRHAFNVEIRTDMGSYLCNDAPLMAPQGNKRSPLRKEGHFIEQVIKLLLD